MAKKNLSIRDNRGFLARLTVLLAPQDTHVACEARKITRTQNTSAVEKEITISTNDRAARFLGSI